MRYVGSGIVVGFYLASTVVLAWFVIRTFAWTDIGQVLVVFDGEHGIHAGDAVALVVSALVVIWLTHICLNMLRRIWMVPGQDAGTSALCESFRRLV